MLKTSVLNSAIWIFLERFGTQFIRFVVQIILARILMPEDFGLVAMISLVINLGQSLRDSGLTQSIIRSNTTDDMDYTTVFYSNIIFSLIIYLIIFFLAPLVAKFYDQYQLISITRVLAFQVVIQSSSAIQVTRLTKVLNFKRQFLVQLPSFIVSGVVGITLAQLGYGVWSLVFMTLTQGVLASIQYWVRSDWKPSINFDIDKFKYHFDYGYKIAISGLLDVIFKDIYTVVIGKYFSASILGFFNRAQTLRRLPLQNISATMNKLTFPLFAKIQDDSLRLREAYSKVIQIVFFVTTPLMVLGFVLAEPLIVVLLTDKWVQTVPYFQLLCISGIVYPLNAYNMNILKVKGRSDLYLKIETIKKLLQLVGVFCFIPFGVMGLLYFNIGFSFFSYLLNSYYSGRMINFSVFDQVKAIFGILVLALIIGLSIFVLDLYFWKSSFNEIVRLLSLSVLAFGLYIFFSRLLKIRAFQMSYDLIKTYKS